MNNMKTKLKARRAKLVNLLARIDRKIAATGKVMAELESQIKTLQRPAAKAA